MDKVRLTAEQAKAFEHLWMNSWVNSAIVEHHILQGWVEEETKSLSGLGNDTLVRALYRI